jgi:hypothetical protein
MSLPTSRNTTYTPSDPVKSAVVRARGPHVDTPTRGALGGGHG